MKKLVLLLITLITISCTLEKELTIKYEEHLYLKGELRKHLVDSLQGECDLKLNSSLDSLDSFYEGEINMLMDSVEYLNLALNQTPLDTIYIIVD